MDSGGLGMGLIAAAFVLGLRHGIDWDHVAALTDIAASRSQPRSAFRLGTSYILGHAAVVLALGLVAISLGARVPESIDGVMGRIVGITLIAMAIYIAVSILQHGSQFRMRSRWMVALDGVRSLWGIFTRRFGSRSPVKHDHEHATAAGVHHPGSASAESGDDAVEVHTHLHTHEGLGDYRARTAAGIGVLHGIGAETPTQVVIFLAAANAGGMAAGLTVLLVFIAGLTTSNLALNLASAFGFLATGRRPALRVAVGATTAFLSFALGVALLLGADSVVPALFAG